MQQLGDHEAHRNAGVPNANAIPWTTAERQERPGMAAGTVLGQKAIRIEVVRCGTPNAAIAIHFIEQQQNDGVGRNRAVAWMGIMIRKIDFLLFFFCLRSFRSFRHIRDKYGPAGNNRRLSCIT